MTNFTLRRRAFLASSLATGLGALSPVAQAQGDRPPLKLLVGFPPGGASDTIARVLADKLPQILKQTVVVENRPGVGGRLAAQAVKAAAPDGTTLMLAPDATFVFQHLTYPVEVLGYDMNKDFSTIARVNSYPLAMVVSAATGARNVKEYVAWRRTAAGQPTFGTAGLGGDTHFNGLQFGKITGVEMTVVPYRGNAPLINDLLGGQIMAGNLVAGDVAQHVKSGKLNFIGVFASKRSSLLPDVPTMLEQGVDTGGDDAWMGVWGPAKMPAAEVQRLSEAIRQVLAMPDVRDTLVNRYLQMPDHRPPAEVDRQMQAQLAHWGPIIKASGFKPQ
jgi:tripartite-type tricarboxylate transporter receptor subunit TctC